MYINGGMVLSNGYTITLAVPAGQAAFTTPGTFSWIAPTRVTAVSVVAVGAGGSGGGTGGGLGWKNCIPVVAGNSYTLVVGSNSPPSSDSYFCAPTVVKGGGFLSGSPFTGTGGGNGGAGGNHGGGGAGGYCGAGGGAGPSSGPGCYTFYYGAPATPGSGGGGGGGGRRGICGAPQYGYNGGGVGIFGKGADGTGGAGPGNAGSGGSGLTYGGGGGYSISPSYVQSNSLGGCGAVRVIWGSGRAFPNTLTTDQ